MSHCEQNHCGSQHEHNHQGSCCCCGATCQHCQGQHQHEECDFSQNLLDLADEAWMEVLKEKIMKQIESHSEGKLDKLAELVSSTNAERWKNKMHAKHGCEDFKAKLKEIFCCGDSSCQKDKSGNSDKKLGNGNNSGNFGKK